MSMLLGSPNCALNLRLRLSSSAGAGSPIITLPLGESDGIAAGEGCSLADASGYDGAFHRLALAAFDSSECPHTKKTMPRITRMISGSSASPTR